VTRRVLVLVVVAIVAGFGAWRAAAAGGPRPVALDRAGRLYTATVLLERAGTGVVDIDVRIPGGEEVTLSAVMPAMGHATPAIGARRAGDGRFAARAELFTMTGLWQLSIRVRGAAGAEEITIDVLVE
jgi:hypothetical protein